MQVVEMHIGATSQEARAIYADKRKHHTVPKHVCFSEMSKYRPRTARNRTAAGHLIARNRPCHHA